MPFPRKFQHLLELNIEDVEVPDYVWLTYAVCGCEPTACGWGGWTIECVFKRTAEDYPTSTGDKILAADDHLKCPLCGKDLFRTVGLRCEPSEDQTPTSVPGVDYQVSATEYED